MGLERLGRGRGVGVRDVEGHAVGKEACRGGKGEGAAGEGLAVDLEAGEPPGAERVGAEAEGEQVLEEPVLGLEVLGREQDALGPDHLLELLHALPWLRVGGDPAACRPEAEQSGRRSGGEQGISPRGARGTPRKFLTPAA